MDSVLSVAPVVMLAVAVIIGTFDRRALAERLRRSDEMYSRLARELSLDISAVRDLQHRVHALERHVSGRGKA